MVFLPATFVATFFSTGFFQFRPDDGNHVNITVSPQWWLYLVVTLPLTVVVLGAWNVWLRWKEERIRNEYPRLGWDESSEESVELLGVGANEESNEPQWHHLNLELH